MSVARMAFLLAAILLLSLSYRPASADELKTPVETCTTADCGATVLDGRINRSDRCCGFANLQIPWVAQLYAGANECLRLHVTAQTTANTVLTAVAPSTQRAWRNDNSSVQPCPSCALLKIRTAANEAGWFLVQVNQSGGGPLNAEFALRYARYAATNPNCAAPTPPLGATAH